MTAVRLWFPILIVIAVPAVAQPMPPDPAPAPPLPARLDASPRLPSPAAGVPVAFPTGLEALPTGGWRVRLGPGRQMPGVAATGDLTELGRRLGTQTTGRVTVTAQASGPAADLSAARRLTLARAEAVKRALAAGGLDATRIDLRPLGRTAEGLDAVDIQPPSPGRAG